MTDPNVLELREKLRESLAEYINTINSSNVSNQEKTAELLAVIAEQIVECRFVLEEISDKL